MAEPREYRLKRLRLRSMRRGIKEMDLILSAFADTQLEDLSEKELQSYDDLLSENDQDLYTWVSGQVSEPAAFSEIVGKIRATLPTL